jgi:peptidoglycan/xylan/chitin deacetylase (PgdA/CDA1 family)
VNASLGRIPVWVRTAGVIAAFVAVLGLAVLAYGPVPVTMDGRLVIVARGTTLGMLAGRDLPGARPGALLSVHGNVLDPAGGGAPTLAVEGTTTPADRLLAAGMRLVTVQGADVVEPFAEKTVEATSGVRYVGRGPYARVESRGTPAHDRVTYGAVSGEEISRFPVDPGTPTVVRREPMSRGPRRVALTFDDGPWHDSTAAIVKILQESGIRATFFETGTQIRNKPLTAQLVRAAGMEIGTHSDTHRYLRHASRKVITREITRGAEAVRTVTGRWPTWYRPAGGLVNAFVWHEARRLKLRLITWTIDPRDWSRPGDRRIVSIVLANVRPGAVILLHDGGGDRSQTVAALPRIIDGLRLRGYEMVTLSALYGLKAPLRPPSRWFGGLMGIRL